MLLFVVREEMKMVDKILHIQRCRTIYETRGMTTKFANSLREGIDENNMKRK